MRIILLFAALSLVPIAAALDVPTIHLPDGITALVSSVGTLSDEIVARDANGDFAFDITIFQNGDDGWAPAQLYSTLRIAIYTPTGEERDAFSQGVPAHTGAARVVVPGEVAFTGRPIDVWVTIYLPDETYPTSHLSVQKNALIAAGDFDHADVFDFHHGLDPIAG